MKTIFFAFLTFLTLASGCAGSHCIELKGTFKEIHGGFVYCFDQSTNANRPILANSAGEKLVLLSEKDLNNIAQAFGVLMVTSDNDSFSKKISAVLGAIQRALDEKGIYVDN